MDPVFIRRGPRPDGEGATLSDVYQLLQAEHERTDERFAHLEGELRNAGRLIQGSLSDVHVQIAELRCPEHRAALEKHGVAVEKLAGEVRRRQWLWSGTGFAAGIAAAAAAVSAVLNGRQ